MAIPLEFQNLDTPMGKKISGSVGLKNDSLNYLQAPNGMGKTSLFNLLAENKIQYFPNKILSYCHQDRLSTLTVMKVSDLIDILADFDISLDAYPEILGPLGSGFYNKQIDQLSGGENQLLKLAIAFGKSADIYLLDEPFQYLDDKNCQNLQKVLEKILSQKKYIFLTHHYKELLSSFPLNEYALSLNSAEQLEIKDV
jgi:translation initiation factor RLI1